VAIAKMLDQIGVDRIETGMPQVGQQEKEAIRAVAELGLGTEIYCSCPAGRKNSLSDIDFCASIGVPIIGTAMPTGVPRLTYHYPEWTEEQSIKNGVQSVSHAKEKGLKVVLNLMDVSRSDKARLERVLTAICKSARPDEVCLLDTAGCLIPAATAFLVTFVKDLMDVPVAIHAHNDMGLGLANTLAALEAGAEVVHVCINGLESAAATWLWMNWRLPCAVSTRRETRVDYRRLTRSRSGGEAVEYGHTLEEAVIGDGIFCRESGLGLRYVQKEPLAIFSLLPEVVGQRSQVVLGKGSGLDSVDIYLKELGIGELTDREQKKIVLGRSRNGPMRKRGSWMRTSSGRSWRTS